MQVFRRETYHPANAVAPPDRGSLGGAARAALHWWVPFAYYAELSRVERLVYDLSDRVRSLPLRNARFLHPLADELRRALASGTRANVERATRALVEGITGTFGVEPVKIRVLVRRPRDAHSELHGLYSRSPRGRTPRIKVWMRTARRRRVVAFRTYLRTVLHELCHHLDFALLGLPFSLHTESFYRRESSLFHQLVPRARAADRRIAASPKSLAAER